ncbi:MAG: glutathione transferase GstA [Pseudomonadales bacterium]|nr:glutathione transferase GstA [Pseudomonadales bacterium]
MKLYYAPGACSMAVHIALNEVGLQYELEKVDLATKKTESGSNYLEVNANGYVPALQLDNGENLTEVSVLLQYIADNNPDKKLLPPVGDASRYRVLEIMNFVSAELHKNFSPMFNPASNDEIKAATLELLGKRFTYVDKHLANRQYLTGDQFTIADAYLTTVLGWTSFLQMDLSPWPKVASYMGKVMSRPSVQATLKAEGLG